MPRGTLRWYHGTRLLPHETEAIRAEGMAELTQELRERRVRDAIRHYPDLISEAEGQAILDDGPLRRERGEGARLGVVCLVAPFDMLVDDVDGFERLLGRWGGEALYWLDDDAGAAVSAVDRLTTVSTPTIVELELPLDGVVVINPRFPVESTEGRHFGAIGPDLIVDLLQPGHPRWPYPAGEEPWLR